MRRSNLIRRNIVTQLGILPRVRTIPRHIPSRQLSFDQFRIFGKKKNASPQPHFVRTLVDGTFKQRRNHASIVSPHLPGRYSSTPPHVFPFGCPLLMRDTMPGRKSSTRQSAVGKSYRNSPSTHPKLCRGHLLAVHEPHGIAVSVQSALGITKITNRIWFLLLLCAWGVRLFPGSQPRLLTTRG